MNASQHSSSKRTANWYYTRGRQFYQAGRYRKAAGAFAKSIRRAPESPMAYAGRGLSLARLRRSQRAVRNLEKAIALAAEKGHFEALPWLTQAAYEGGRAHERLGQHFLALRCYTKALDLSSDSTSVPPHEILRRRGRVKLRIKQFEAALEDLNQALDLDPGNAIAYLNRAHAHEALGHTDGAMDDLRTYLRLADPGDPHRTEALAYITKLTQ